MKNIFFVFTFLVMVFISLFFWGNGRDESNNLAKLQNAPAVFPSNFFWGTATSAQQIESQSLSDWTVFEKDVIQNSKTIYSGKGINPPLGHISSLDQYSKQIRSDKLKFSENFKNDLKMAKEMGTNAFRFSISWSRLFPNENDLVPDQSAIIYYQNLIKYLKLNNIEPFLTLFHFSSPSWFWRSVNGKKGWEREDAHEKFSKFVSACVKFFGADINYWTTINEPMVYLYKGYVDGFYPPFEKRDNPNLYAPIFASLLKAHLVAYKIIKKDAKERNKKAFVGIAKHSRIFNPLRVLNIFDRIIARVTEQAFMYDFFDALDTGKIKVSGSSYDEILKELGGTQDYLGINYYGPVYIKTQFSSLMNPVVYESDPLSKGQIVNEMGQASYPHGLYNVVKKVYQKYRLPIFILENGVADSDLDDKLRQRSLKEHIKELWSVMSNEKIDVRGYFHWSLMDNFEWNHGFEQNFGLIQVDFKNKGKRKFRKSAFIFKEVASTNQIPKDW